MPPVQLSCTKSNPLRFPSPPQVASFLADETEIGEWSVEGLPSDDLSVQNGILVTRATRYPVLIDPQGQVGWQGVVVVMGQAGRWWGTGEQVHPSKPQPQCHLQGRTWLLSREAKNGLRETQLNDK